MFELHEIEELFKSEDLVKNKAMIHAVLRHAATLHNPEASAADKARAAENIKAITHGKQPKPKKVKAEAAAAPSGPVGQIKHKYSPAYQHYGVTEQHWNAAKPDAHKALFEHHNNVMAGKVPESAHIKTAVEQAKAQSVKKSIDHLHDLFSELKKHL